MDKTLFSSVLPTLRTVEVNGLLNFQSMSTQKGNLPLLQVGLIGAALSSQGRVEEMEGVGLMLDRMKAAHKPRDNFKPDRFRKE